MGILKDMNTADSYFSIYNYTDYRCFLSDAYKKHKSKDRCFTYRYIASCSGFKSPGFFTQVLSGQSNLGKQTAIGLAKAFGLDEQESHYFYLMIAYNQTFSHNEKKRLFEQMLRFCRGRLQTLDPDHYQFYDKWYYSAIRALLTFYKFDGDYKKLGKQLVPAISGTEALKAVELLEKLDMIKKDDAGRYMVTRQLLSTGENADPVVVNNFIVNTLDISRDALYRFQKSTRSFSALTLSLSSEGYEKIRKKLDAVRKEIMEIAASDSGVNAVYQLNMQYFPLNTINGEDAR